MNALENIKKLHKARPEISQQLSDALKVLADYWRRGSNTKIREMYIVKAWLTALELCGDFNTQSRIIQHLATKEYVLDFPDTFPKVWFSQMNQTETAFLELVEKNDHSHSRAVINFYNDEKQLSYVYSVKCMRATWNGTPLQPREGELWLDINCGSATLSMCVEDVPTEIKDADFLESLVIPGSDLKKIEAVVFYSPIRSLYHEITVTSDRGNLTILLDPDSETDWERIYEFVYFIAKLKLETNFDVTTGLAKNDFDESTTGSNFTKNAMQSVFVPPGPLTRSMTRTKRPLLPVKKKSVTLPKKVKAVSKSKAPKRIAPQDRAGNVKFGKKGNLCSKKAVYDYEDYDSASEDKKSVTVDDTQDDIAEVNQLPVTFKRSPSCVELKLETVELTDMQSEESEANQEHSLSCNCNSAVDYVQMKDPVDCNGEVNDLQTKCELDAMSSSHCDFKASSYFTEPILSDRGQTQSMPSLLSPMWHSNDQKYQGLNDTCECDPGHSEPIVVRDDLPVNVKSPLTLYADMPMLISLEAGNVP